MKTFAIRILYFALPTVWFVLSMGISTADVSSTAAAEPKHQYGNFSPSPEKLQVFLDYIHSLKMTINVEAGAELQQAIATIPIEPSVPITPEQEADLRGWLYDFLVAFSVSGNDSLAASFYLREGVNNPGGLKKIKKNLVDWGLLQGDTPFDILQAMHRSILDYQDFEYRFGNASFIHSTFKVFEMQGHYESYLSYAKAYGMVAAGGLYIDTPQLQEKVEEAVQTGEQRVCAQFMFITEEPEEFTKSKRPIRTPFFFRLVWDPKRTMWRFVECFYNSDLPHFFLLSKM